MKNQSPFFKNAFKNLIKNKIQLITIIILVFLTAFVFTLSYSSTSRITKSYNSFISEENSNLHDFVIDLSSSSYINDFDNDLFSKNISNSEVRDNLLLTYLQNQLNDTDLAFDFDRVESRTTTLNNKTLKIFALNPDQVVDKFVVNRGMSMELWKQYTQAINVDTKRWVYLNEEFAKANNIRVNDIIRLQSDVYGTSVKVVDSELQEVDLTLYENIDINSWFDNTAYAGQNWFQVVGFGSTADFSTPVIDETKPLPNTKDEALAYIDPSNLGLKNAYYQSVFPENIFNLTNPETQRIWYTDSEIKNEEIISASSNLDKEIVFVAKFRNATNITTSTDLINEYLTNLDKAKEMELYAGYENTLNKTIPIALEKGDTRYTFYSRTTMLEIAIDGYRTFSYIVMIVTLGIGIVMLIVMLNNQIKKSFGQSGVLLSLGYKKSQLIWSNGLYPLFISVTGGLVGYILGMVMQQAIIAIATNFFSIKMDSFEFSWESAIVTVVGMFIFLEIITLITYFYMFGKYSPLQMIHFESRSSTNGFKLKLKRILTRGHKFDARFRGAILSGSVAKLVSVFSVMLVSSILITIGSIMPNVMKENMNKTYLKDGYDNEIEYQTPIYNAPTSFYKTYNPYSTGDNLDLTLSSSIFDMYLNNNASEKIYNPSTDVGSLNDMTYKSIDIDYLQNTDLTLVLGDDISTEQRNNFYKTVILNLWQDLKNFSIDVYWNKETFLDIVSNDTKARENIEDLEKIRQFYLKYRNTLGLDVRRTGYIFASGRLNNSGGPAADGSPMVSEGDFYKSFGRTYTFQQVDVLANGQIRNDEPFERSLYDYVDGDGWTEKRVTTIVPIYNWIIAYFFNNLQQAFLQGIYSNSPALVKQTIEEQYNDEDGNFNVTFGLIPYNSEKEDIGVYLNGNSQGQSLKLYGLKQDNKTQVLNNSDGTDLKSKLFEKEDSIVINQSVAKRLNLKTGDKVNINHVINALNYGQEELDLSTWDSSGLSAANSDDGYTTASNFYNVGMMTDNGNGWKNSTINPDGDNRVYKSDINISSPTLVGATAMSRNVADGTVSVQSKEVDFEYTVAGIVDQYGDNKAWIQNNVAKSISNYDDTEKLLFRLFMEEWSNPKTPTAEITTLSNFLNGLKNSLLSNDELYASFLTFASTSGNEKYLELFESEYPMFNYKTSLDTSFTDISKGVSTNQKYGDYSMIGLNGGSDNTTSYTGYSNSSIENVMQIDEALRVLARINNTVEIIIYFVVFVSIFLSAIIILLTINLVISENAKIIAVMKILGYKESYISKLFIGIYVPVAIVSSLFGLGVAWLIVSSVIGALTSIIVLPLGFSIWYIFPGVIGTWLLYSISNVLSWMSLKRVSMLIAVQGGN